MFHTVAHHSIADLLSILAIFCLFSLQAVFDGLSRWWKYNEVSCYWRSQHCYKKVKNFFLNIIHMFVREQKCHI